MKAASDLTADIERPILYFAPDTCSLASLIACYDAGMEPTVKEVSFARDEQLGKAYRAINPSAKVPAIVFGKDIVVETPAILMLIAQLAPTAELVPVAPVAQAKVQAFNSYLCSTLHVAHAHRMRGYRWLDGEEHEEAMRQKVPEAVDVCYAHIEHHLMQGPFVFGESYTIADPYLFTISRWMESDGCGPDDFPKVAAHRRLMGERTSVAQALAIEAKMMADNV
ncbi:glutathione S-transferase [Jannaschia sp. S6380]|uniref:glutathione S-transferase family protein n=1 Tax=Jannaschia sp. S6380 TaxID=2926408 RepID=UPI001FF4C452|nr:glutathione S-transferase [Jannaschia sp. S6380]MCK0168383.1 glutathione S-transferase [Jannaschia sp. S6380]